MTTRKGLEIIEDKKGKQMISKLKTAYSRYQKRRATMNELYSLSDSELSDIGINRSDIMRIVKEVQH